MTVTSMHSHLSISSLCFPALSVAQQLEAVANIGGRYSTLSAEAVAREGPDAVRGRCQDLAIGVPALIFGHGPPLDDETTWSAMRDKLSHAVDSAASLGAGAVYMLTGGSGGSRWDEAVERFGAFVGPCVERAAGTGVAISVEPAMVLYADFTFVHTAAAGFELAQRIPGMKVCFDLFHTWTEPRLRETLEASVSDISLVQVSDYVLGDRSLPARAVPGDGAVPIGEVIRWLWAGGYRGIVDLELNGPRIDIEGHDKAARRAADALDALLTRVTGVAPPDA